MTSLLSFQLEKFRGSYEQFSERVRRVADNATLAVKTPHDDPDPFLVAWHPGDSTLAVARLPDEWFSSHSARHALGSAVLAPTARDGVTRMGVVSAAWQVDSDSPAGRELQRLRDAGLPAPWYDELGLDGVREEMFAVVMDPEHADVWSAPISRTVVAPPQLGEWKLHTNVRSRWYDAVREVWS